MRLFIRQIWVEAAPTSTSSILLSYTRGCKLGFEVDAFHWVVVPGGKTSGLGWKNARTGSTVDSCNFDQIGGRKSTTRRQNNRLHCAGTCRISGVWLTMSPTIRQVPIREGATVTVSAAAVQVSGWLLKSSGGDPRRSTVLIDSRALNKSQGKSANNFVQAK